MATLPSTPPLKTIRLKPSPSYWKCELFDVDTSKTTKISFSALLDSYYSPVRTNILNEKNLSPVHLATEQNKVKALQIIGRYSNLIDIQQGGEHGRTALHLAAIYDHEECARILVGQWSGTWTSFKFIAFPDNRVWGITEVLL